MSESREIILAKREGAVRACAYWKVFEPTTAGAAARERFVGNLFPMPVELPRVVPDPYLVHRWKVVDGTVYVECDGVWQRYGCGGHPSIVIDRRRSAILADLFEHPTVDVGPAGSWDGYNERCEHGLRWETPCSRCRDVSRAIRTIIGNDQTKHHLHCRYRYSTAERCTCSRRFEKPSTESEPWPLDPRCVP